MFAVSQTIRRYVKELLAVLVAIMFLVAPMAEAAPVICDNGSPQVAHIETSMGDVAGQGDFHPAEQKGCCKNVCSLCNVILPASDPVVFHLDSGAQRYFDPQQSITGLRSSPALGPPRTIG
ncbi:hypothetical protein [Rhizobium sp. PL01]|uniref:hypothetical protein n=1 Tax=Rhizobium sp. PL01 TaxID=3085631 RepID=UPI002982092F|nr:hypothetical protein [Rhizobium sp. PL01]MDW5317640.1 hypothetical protein [Rhizobium sp. PL01]